MNNTPKSFLDKWERNKDLAWEITQQEGSEIFSWIVNRNGFSDATALRKYLGSKHRVLDAGCGNGRVTALLRRYSPASTEVVGVDLVAAEIARENLKGEPNLTIHQGDLLKDLNRLGRFDFIYCQEVLHHTGNPQKGFENLVSLLEPNGEIAIYVYKVKAPCREYVDDFVRSKIKDLPYEEAMKACRQITVLGRELSQSGGKVKVSNVDILGIEAGEYDIQRFVYHFFMKCFWNSNLDFEANAAINYDWYHPQDATRHTLEEVRGWYQSQQLEIQHEFVDQYGITIRGKRKG